MRATLTKADLRVRIGSCNEPVPEAHTAIGRPGRRTGRAVQPNYSALRLTAATVGPNDLDFRLGQCRSPIEVCWVWVQRVVLYSALGGVTEHPSTCHVGNQHATMMIGSHFTSGIVMWGRSPSRSSSPLVYHACTARRSDRYSDLNCLTRCPFPPEGCGKPRRILDDRWKPRSASASSTAAAEGAQSGRWAGCYSSDGRLALAISVSIREFRTFGESL